MPVRYVVAIVLATALVAAGTVALDQVEQSRSRQQVEGEIATIEETAQSLVANEDLPPPGQRGARRVLTIELPGDASSEEPLEYLQLQQGSGNTSIAEYRIADGPTHKRYIDAPLHAGSGDGIEFHGDGTEVDLVLRLEADEHGRPVVTIRRR